MKGYKAEPMFNSDKCDNARLKIEVLIIAFLIMTFCSRNSFLYPFNFECDINIYKTIGRGMMDGLLPYRDLFDHKGPYVFILFYILETWEPLVFILEVVLCAITLYYAYFVMMLLGKGNKLGLIAFAIVVYFNVSFHSGGAVEEFFLPMGMYMTYKGLDFLIDNSEPSSLQLILIGILGGFILWSKFSILGFFIGWCIVPLIRTYQWKGIKGVLHWIYMIGLGVIITTLPLMIYFLVTGTMGDFIDAYFLSNLQYVQGDGLFINILVAFTYLVKQGGGVLLALVIPGIICLFKKDYKVDVRIYLFLILAFTILGQYSGGRVYTQYFFPLSIFALFSVIEFTKHDIHNIIRVAFALIIITLSCYLNKDIKIIGFDETKTPQYVFAEIMNQDEEPSLLLYNCMDYGFYDKADITPNCKYFFECSIEGLQQEIRDKYLEDKLVTFYICKDKPVEFDGYELIEDMTYSFYSEAHWYLYRLEG